MGLLKVSAQECVYSCVCVGVRVCARVCTRGDSVTVSEKKGEGVIGMGWVRVEERRVRV